MIIYKSSTVGNGGDVAFPESSKADAKYLSLLGNFLCYETVLKYPSVYEIQLYSTLLEASLCKAIYF